MSVAFDAAVSAGTGFGVTSLGPTALTIGAGANRAVKIDLAFSATTPSSIAVTFNSVSAPAIAGTDSGASGNTVRTACFGVAGPASGSHTASASWTNAVTADMGVVSASNVDQTTPFNNGTFAAGTAQPAAMSLTVTSTAGDLTSTVGNDVNDSLTATPTNQTLKWGVDSSAFGGDIGPGTGTTTHTWNGTNSGQDRSISGANFAAAGSGGGSSFLRRPTSRPFPFKPGAPRYQ